MARLLVTGGAGFIGANFVHYWVTAHPNDRVVVLDALTYAGNLANLGNVQSRAEVRFVRGNVCDGTLVEALLRQEGIDTVVHFAAESHVDRSIHGPDAFVETNVLGTHSLLKAARKVWLEERAVDRCRFHHVSTDEVYGSLDANDPGFNENTAYAPNSPYSATKAASDHLVRAYHRTYGLPVTTSNCTNNYGPFQFPEKLIPLVIINILHGKELPIYGDGRHVRDWLHVSDHCYAIDLVLGQGRVGEAYNIGGGSESENIELVRSLCQLTDEAFEADAHLAVRFPACPAARGEPNASLIKFVADRPGHDRRYAIDCRKIARELGYAPLVSIEDGLRAALAWYLRHESWWRSLLQSGYQDWVRLHYRCGAPEVSPGAGSMT